MLNGGFVVVAVLVGGEGVKLSGERIGKAPKLVVGCHADLRIVNFF